MELSQGTILCKVLAFQSALESSVLASPIFKSFILEQSSDATKFARDNIFTTSRLKVSLVFITLIKRSLGKCPLPHYFSRNFKRNRFKLLYDKYFQIQCMRKIVTFYHILVHEEIIPYVYVLYHSFPFKMFLSYNCTIFPSSIYFKVLT